ncbi:MAG: histidine phosphatase family protein [Rhodobacteraceae bacterium]|nr:histidine phosphatase family protein [Paracoccaceae bacterium]
MAEFHQHKYSAPTGSCTIVLIRHGQTIPARPDAPFALKDGHGDPELLPVGHAQAERAAVALQDAPLAAIYVTSLQRTHQTAAPLAASHGLAPIEAPDLREVFLGDWEGGLYRIKTANRDPAALRARTRQDWGEIPGAETAQTLRRRVMRALHGIAARHSDQTVAAVVHGGVIGMVLATATGAAPSAFIGAENGSISRLVITPDGYDLRGFNEVTHLAGL